VKEYTGKGTFKLSNGITYPRYISCLVCKKPYLQKTWRDKMHPKCRKERERERNLKNVKKFNERHKNKRYKAVIDTKCTKEQRRCLKCGKLFNSKFNGNRICQGCRATNNKNAPTAEGI